MGLVSEVRAQLRDICIKVQKHLYLQFMKFEQKKVIFTNAQDPGWAGYSSTVYFKFITFNNILRQ